MPPLTSMPFSYGKGSELGRPDVSRRMGSTHPSLLPGERGREVSRDATAQNSHAHPGFFEHW